MKNLAKSKNLLSRALLCAVFLFYFHLTWAVDACKVDSAHSNLQKILSLEDISQSPYYKLIPESFKPTLAKNPALWPDVELWLKAMEAKKKFPELNNAALGMKIDATSHLPTVERMLTSIKNAPFQDAELLSIAQKFSMPAEAAEELVRIYQKSRAELTRKLQQFIDRKTLTYTQLNKYSYSFSALIHSTDFEALAREVSEGFKNKNYFLFFENGGKLKKDIPSLARDYFKQEFTNLKLDITLPKNFPYVISIPTWKELSFTSFNQLHGLPIAYNGIIDTPTFADGIRFTPRRFIRHDGAHALTIFENQTIRSHFEGLSVLEKTRKVSISGSMFDVPYADFTAEQLDALTKLAFERNKVYVNYYEKIKDWNFKKRQIAQALFFQLDHETSRLHQKTYQEFAQFLKTQFKTATYEGVSTNITLTVEALARRLNNPNDFAQAFGKKSLPITEADIRQVIDELPD